jgi:tRNA-(ms[2]io[6]A)-hydroxylase
MADFETFLKDHAACEKKAHASALVLVSHYPDRRELVTAMIDLAREELEHYQQVWQLLDARGLTLASDRRDEYVRKLLACMRNGREPYFLDRLLVFAIVEARGCERFGLVAEALEAGELKDFYTDITRSEARHHGLFTRLAKIYFDEKDVAQRLEELLAQEATIIQQLPIQPVLH